MEELKNLTLLDCVENVQYTLKVKPAIFDRAQTDTMFATQLLEYCRKEDCFEFDEPMATYTEDHHSESIGKENQLPTDTSMPETETFPETPSTSFQASSTSGKTYNKAKAKKSMGNKSTDIKNWSANEVLLLIAVYKDHQLDFLDANINNCEVWAEIATQMNDTLSSQGLPPIAAEKCKTKWETLKRQYKKLKDLQKSSGSAPMTWPYYDEMEEVFGEQPWVKPLSTAGSNTTNKMDPDTISPPRKRQKNLTHYCEELLAAKKESNEIRQKHHREKIASIAQLSGALNRLVDHLTKRDEGS